MTQVKLECKPAAAKALAKSFGAMKAGASA